jgi:hypothetical protein
MAKSAHNALIAVQAVDRLETNWVTDLQFILFFVGEVSE